MNLGPAERIHGLHELERENINKFFFTNPYLIFSIPFSNDAGNIPQ